MRIGKNNIPSKFALALAPMAGYTNVAMREMMANMGADIVYSELASAAALAKEYKNPSGGAKMTQNIIRSAKKGINGIQIFGANKEEIEGGIKFIEQYLQTQECKAKFIDLNLGCPAAKVCTIGAGCELLKDFVKLEQIVKVAVRTSSLPVTVKMRLMPSIDDSIRVAKMFKKKGIDAIAIHGRTQKQKYTGFANWGAIRQIGKQVDIPVIGNGDVRSPQDADKMLKIAQCDGVMIGRTSLLNPFIFMEIRDFGGYNTPRKFGVADKIRYLEKYFGLCREYDIAFVEAKELCVQLVGGVKNASRIRDLMVRAKSHEQLLEIFSQITQNENRI